MEIENSTEVKDYSCKEREREREVKKRKQKNDNRGKKKPGKRQRKKAEQKAKPEYVNDADTMHKKYKRAMKPKKSK